MSDRMVTPMPAATIDRTASTDEVKREAFDATARLLLSESQRAPVIVLIEDLHWLDDASRELFTKLLKDEEEHVDWLEAQLHMIKEMGYERYLSIQAEGKNE